MSTNHQRTVNPSQIDSSGHMLPLSASKFLHHLRVVGLINEGRMNDASLEELETADDLVLELGDALVDARRRLLNLHEKRRLTKPAE